MEAPTASLRTECAVSGRGGPGSCFVERLPRQQGPLSQHAVCLGAIGDGARRLPSPAAGPSSGLAHREDELEPAVFTVLVVHARRDVAYQL